MLKLALRNLSRQWLRSGMTLAAIAFGVVGLMLTGGFINDVYHQLGEAFIHTQTGHLQLARNGYFDQGGQAPEKFLLTEPQTIVNRISALPEVEDAMARLDFSGLLNNGEADLSVMGEGIEPESEARLNSWLKLHAGRQLRTDDTNGVLIGKGVADALKLKPGDAVTLLANTPEGALNTVELNVVGIFSSYAKDYDDRAIRVPLSVAQELLTVQGATRIVVLLDQRERTEQMRQKIAQQLQSGLEVRTWIELNDFYTKTVSLYEGQFGVLQVVILLMVMLSVSNSVNMSIFERMGEFGTMRALGNNSRYITCLVIVENALLGASGALVGAALGIVLALIVSWVGIDMPAPPNMSQGYTATIRITLGTFFGAFCIGVLSTLIACLWPAWRVGRKPIVDALRQNI